MNPLEVYPLTRQHDIDHLNHNYIDLKFSNDEWTEFLYKGLVIVVYENGSIFSGVMPYDTMQDAMVYIDKFRTLYPEK